MLVVLSVCVGVMLGLTRSPGAEAAGGKGEPLSVTAADDPSEIVEVRVWPRGPGGRAVSWHVACPGDARCAALQQALPQLTREASGPCPRMRTGVREATVTGTIAGRHVAAFIDQRDGCGAARWRALAPVLRAR